MDTIIPLILIALGSATIVVGREGRVLLVGLGMQWAGVAWAVLTLGAGGGPLAAVIVEGLTALVSIAIMWVTLAGVDEMLPESVSSLDSAAIERLKRAEARARRRLRAQIGAVDQLWPLVIVLAGGVAGFALARLYPLGGSEAALLAFYWVTLTGVLALVIDGAREPVKLGVGLLALLNGAFLLVETLGLGVASNPVALGLMSASKIALAGIVAYGWGMLKSSYNELDLTPLFDSRNEVVSEEVQEAKVENIEMAIATTEGPDPNE
ncbi:MAG TPA: hypothetical protein VJ183_18025 [Chloroflexia bacterium]|nr:hypothetical protein [Chloroflexia bacterium]